MLNYVAPEEFKAYWHYVMGYLQVHEGYFERFIIGGPKDDGAFGALLRPYMLRRTKEEVAPQLPERIDIVEHVALGLKQGELYDAFKKQKDIVVVVDDKEMLIKNALVLLVRLQQLSAWPPLLDFPPTVLSGKLEWLREFLEDHPDDRMVIFTRFRALALEIARVHNASLVIGGQKELDGNPRLLVGTIDAMGEGLNLGWAKHAIFLDSHWSTIKMTQAIDRIHRIDVIEPKNIYLLWSSKEDLLVLKALEHKWSEAELVYHFIKDLN
jgi:SNF2 family DNA or RNA helicase